MRPGILRNSGDSIGDVHTEMLRPRRHALPRKPLGAAVAVLLVLLHGEGAWPAAAPAQGAPGARPAMDWTEPGQVSGRATFTCLGVTWPIAGDDNLNARCAARFRRAGTESWREALPLFRVRHGTVNALIGSIFHLAPGTAYEVQLRLYDGDRSREGVGLDVTRTIALATRSLPATAADGRTLPVRCGELPKILPTARPGDVLLLESGDHGPGVTVSVSGEPGRPIVIRGPEEGEAVIGGAVSVAGAGWVWLDRLTVAAQGQRFGVAGRGAPSGVAVTRSKVIGAHYLIGAYGADWYVADTVLVGDKKGGLEAGRIHMSGEGIEFKGRGHVAAFNDISRVADGVSYGQGDIDVCHNLVHDTTDDLLEPDYAYDNYRIWHNRCWMTLNGLSFQPINGGPWYVFNNQLTGTRVHTFKLRSGAGPRVLAGNTLIQTGYTMNVSRLWEGVWANNVWLQAPRGRLGYGGRFERALFGLMDHNAYYTGDAPLWQLAASSGNSAWDLARMGSEGLERHSLVIKPHEALTNLPADIVNGTGEPIRPRPGSPLIDAGVALPNLTGPFLGKAPDIGAVELGLGAPWCGPRRFTAEGLAFGCPPGWQVAAPAEPQASPLEGGRLLLTRSAPAAQILAAFEPIEGEARWKRFEEVVSALAGLRPGSPAAMFFRDGLAGRIQRGRPGAPGAAPFIGARVEPAGVLIVTGRCAEKDLTALQDDFFTFLRSLYH